MRTQARPLECAAPRVAADTPSPMPQQASRGGHADRWLPQRSPFIGRDDERERLLSGFEAAEAGHGTLVMLVGEPGIGKTALCDQLATHIAARGGRSLVGHCYEQGSFSRPYQPFVEVLESYARASRRGRPARLDRVRVQTKSRESSRRFATSFRCSCPRQATLRRVAGACWRRCSTFCVRAAAAQPLVLVLEDLHDADRGTLDLLVHLGRNLEGTRLLLVCTYRDVEVDRAHPLSAALIDLRRAANFARVHLRGLSVDDVQRMLASASQHAIPRPFVELVHRRTEGNPLFVHEMLRFVVEEGLVERRDGALRRVGEESIAGRIPEGLRDVVGKRLSRLSAATNQVLSVGGSHRPRVPA